MADISDIKKLLLAFQAELDLRGSKLFDTPWQGCKEEKWEKIQDDTAVEFAEKIFSLDFPKDPEDLISEELDKLSENPGVFGDIKGLHEDPEDGDIEATAKEDDRGLYWYGN